MINPFMPNGYLETFNSLNRLVLGETTFLNSSHPGSPQAVSLLSADVLTDRIEAQKDKLGIPASLHRSFYALYTGRLAAESGSRESALAREILKEWVEHVICFFDVLLQGRRINREARAEWGREHWEFWKSRKTIIIGGGLSMGYMGTLLKRYVEPVLYKLGKNLLLPAVRNSLPMIGAVLAVPGVEEGNILGFDFGHTSVKSALFQVREGLLVSSENRPSVIVKRDFHMAGNDFSVNPEELRNFFYRVIQEILISEKQFRRVDGVGISIANYVQDGRVVDRGMYGNLAYIDKPGGADIFTPVSAILKKHNIPPDSLSILHDGTAAANCFFYEKDPAVILFGSAIGGGFPGREPHLKWDENSFCIK